MNMCRAVSKELLINRPREGSRAHSGSREGRLASDPHDVKPSSVQALH